MHLDEVWLTDFRNYASVHLSPAPGLTVLRGDNGQGKTNLLEAIAHLALGRSFRGAATDALVREGVEAAIIRAEGNRAGRDLLFECEINPGRGPRMQVNRQTVRTIRDRAEFLQVSVFTPDDLVLVKGGPSERRVWIDDVLVARHPALGSTASELSRVLRQRNVLLKQARGRVTAEVRATLDVWNQKLIESGEALVAGRRDLLAELAPRLAEAYDAVARRASEVAARYEAPWLDTGLAVALANAEDDDLRRGVTTVGPHRDDVGLSIGGLPARTHASQGEQRSLALALRLAAHRLLTEVSETPPVLLLDDIFSELDPGRAAALLAALPVGQTLLTTAGLVPPEATPELVVEVKAGSIQPG